MATTEFRVTHIGTATLLLEIAGFRLLTDPVFDPAGKRYRFPFFLSSRKLEDPALAAQQVLPIDIVLLSHDHHADNLDIQGRALLPQAGVTLTTLSGARRLRSQLGEKVQGYAHWQAREFTSPNGDWLRITAVPSQHYQRPLFKCLVGETNGFVIEWGDPVSPSTIYLSGDTVDFHGLDEIARRFKIDTAFMHLGGVKFGLTGPLRYTLNAQEAKSLALRLKIKRLIPIHYAGWTHFRESFQAHQKQLIAPNGEYELQILERGRGYTFK